MSQATLNRMKFDLKLGSETDGLRLFSQRCITWLMALEALEQDRDELLAACKFVMRTCGGPENWKGDTHEFLLACQAAIAKAKRSAT